MFDSKRILNIGTQGHKQISTCALLLYRVTVNTTLTGLTSGFASGLLNNFYASVLQQELIWSQAMFALCTKHKLSHAHVDVGC